MDVSQAIFDHRYGTDRHDTRARSTGTSRTGAIRGIHA